MLSRFHYAIAGSLIFAAANASAAEPKTAAAVLAADDAWGAAEVRGDVDFIDHLLLPEYRSIGPTGKVTTKATIVEHTRKRACSADEQAKAQAAVAAWKAAHPSRADVVLVGDTAVLTWILLKPGSDEPISSSDIFLYRDGHWRAIYSQHTSAST